MYTPGCGATSRAPWPLGATMEEIMETLKIATSFGQETINMAIPILARKLLHSRRRNSLVAPKRVSAALADWYWRG